MKIFLTFFILISSAFSEAQTCLEIFGSNSKSSSREEISLEKPVFSVDKKYLKKVFVNKEKRNLQKNTRMMGQEKEEKTLSLFKTKDTMNWTHFEKERVYRKKAYEKYSHVLFDSMKTPETFQASLEVLHFVAFQYSRLYPTKFQITGKKPSRRSHNLFEFKGDQILDKISNTTYSLFPEKNKNEHPLVTAGKLVDFDMVLARPLKKPLFSTEKDKPPVYEHQIEALFVPTATSWDKEFLRYTMTDIHGARMDKALTKAPSQSHLSQMINRMLTMLPPLEQVLESGQILERNNWFIELSPHLLLHADGRRGGDKYNSRVTSRLKKAVPVLEQFYFRSEYETLVRLPNGHILFTIKPFVYPLSEAVKSPGMAAKLLEGMEHRDIGLSRNHINKIKSELIKYKLKKNKEK